MIGIVWCKEEEKGIEKLKEILSNYKRMGVSILSFEESFSNGRSKLYYLSNGDKWLLNIFGVSCPIICNLAYIDLSIGRKNIERDILPSIRAHPFNGYRYYS